MGGKQRKKLQADILEEWIEMQKRQRDAGRPIRRRQPRITPMQSPRMRRAMRQTADPLKAGYQAESPMNATPVRPNKKGLTREVGPNDDKNNPGDYRAGKDTGDRDPPKQKRS
jgi:hypothetical protein